jgi:hypothetical protein
VATTNPPALESAAQGARPPRGETRLVEAVTSPLPAEASVFTAHWLELAPVAASPHHLVVDVDVSESCVSADAAGEFTQTKAVTTSIESLRTHVTIIGMTSSAFGAVAQRRRASADANTRRRK